MRCGLPSKCEGDWVMKDTAGAGQAMVAGQVRVRDGRSGTTLVEVMVACFILAIMAIGTGAYLHQGQAGIGVQRNRRAALEAASSRLEHIRSSNYANLEPSNNRPHFVSRRGGKWRLTLNDPNETATVNGVSYPLTTTVRRVRAYSPAREYLVFRVAMGYQRGSGDRIVLETIMAP